MRKTLTTTALLLAFSCPTFAGEMATPGSPAPPPTTASAVQELTAGSVIPSDVTDSLTEIALNLLVVLPSLL